MAKKNSILENLYPQKTFKKIENEISLLGGDAKFDAITFMNARLFTTIFVFFLCLYFLKPGYLFAPVVTIPYYYLFHYLLITRPIKKRTKKLDHDALYFFEILTLTLASGKNLENSLEVTCFNIESDLSNEFKKALFEMKFGKSLMEALGDMKKRIPSDTINNILLNITQTDVFGSNIIDTMYHQIHFLRDKQSLEIKGEINKIPNRISIVSVLFIVPLILMLILGPLLLTFIGQ